MHFNTGCVSYTYIIAISGPQLPQHPYGDLALDCQSFYVAVEHPKVFPKMESRIA